MTKNSKVNNSERQHSKMRERIKYSINIGFFSGVIWGLISLLAYYMQFTDVGPSIYAKPMLNPDYVLKWEGHLIGIIFFIILSILFSIIYGVLLVRFKTSIAGVLYGIFLWALIFLVINPLMDLTKSVKELGLNTNSVMINIYILVGLFIGFSISVEFNNVDKE